MPATKLVNVTKAYVIETNVPMPKKGGISKPYRQAIYDLSKSVVGASVFIPETHGPAGLQRVSQAARYAGGPGWFRARQVEGGYRIWKVA